MDSTDFVRAERLVNAELLSRAREVMDQAVIQVAALNANTANPNETRRHWHDWKVVDTR
jgi:hypothetical protein